MTGIGGLVREGIGGGATGDFDIGTGAGVNGARETGAGA